MPFYIIYTITSVKCRYMVRTSDLRTYTHRFIKCSYDANLKVRLKGARICIMFIRKTLFSMEFQTSMLLILYAMEAFVENHILAYLFIRFLFSRILYYRNGYMVYAIEFYKLALQDFNYFHYFMTI